MEIAARELKSVDVLTVSGRVDSSTAPRLDQTLKGLLDNKRSRIVLDLSGVAYLSSAGLRTMVSCRRSGGDLRLANPSKRVKQVLELAGLDVVFKIYKDQVAAVGSF